jgi:hypothetical protein
VHKKKVLKTDEISVHDREMATLSLPCTPRNQQPPGKQNLRAVLLSARATVATAQPHKSPAVIDRPQALASIIAAAQAATEDVSQRKPPVNPFAVVQKIRPLDR